MLTAVRNQGKVVLLSIKYNIMREMLNKATFLSNIFFMILNNGSMIVQWIVLYSLRDNIGGYTFKQVLLLWGLAAGVYGISHFFFEKAYHLSTIINTGKLDAYIVQPKNVLLSAITSDIQVSALGDLLFAYIMYFLYGFSIKSFLLYTLFMITGGFILTSVSVILNSLSFWFHNTDTVADLGNSLMVNFATYPDGIFKGVIKALLFTLIPVGIANYIPIAVITKNEIPLLFLNVGISIFLVAMAFFIFYRGLKRYSSSNLMSARV